MTIICKVPILIYVKNLLNMVTLVDLGRGKLSKIFVNNVM